MNLLTDSINVILPQNTIPSELLARNHWVNWGPRKNKQGETINKMPIDPKTGKNAHSNYPATWGSFDQAAAGVTRFQNISGFGFVFSEQDPYCGVDLDKCRDQQTGVVEPWAVDIVADLASYTEISPSGTGLHILVRGKVPGKRNRSGHIEMYDRGRYFTMTGTMLPGTPATINERQDALDRLYARTLNENALPQSQAARPLDLSDRELIQRIKSSAQGAKFDRLWQGDISDYGGDDSAADLALCNILRFWTGGDAGRIDSLFRQSGLMRPKWDRPDYRTRTIEAACRTQEYYDPQRSTRVMPGAMSEVSEPVAEEWPEPTPLRRSADPPEFPTDALPVDVGKFVDALSDFAQTPKGLAASMALGMLAAALAGKCEIKARTGYTEPLNLYLLALLPPASRKSSVLNEITKPLRDFEKDAIAKARPEVAQSESQYKRLKKKLEFLENAYAKGTGTKKPKQKTGEESNIPAVADAVQVSDIDRLAADLAEFKVKKLPQYIIQDITAERTASKLDENSGVLALFSPEGELIENAKGRYSKGFNFEVYLKAHSGDPLKVDRENPEKKPIYVDRPLLTIGICAQPDVITELPAAFSGRGLLARFLYCVPASNIGQRKVKTEPVPLSVAAGYYGCIKKLLDIPVVTDESGRRDEVQFTLNREATSLLDEFAEDVEKALGDPERLGALPEWGGKFVGAVLRIAGLLHAADNAGNIDAMLRPIQADTLLRAIRIGDFFMEHAKTAFSIMKTSETVVNAEFILSWLRRGQIREIQRKTLLDKLRGRFRTAAELDEPLKMLCEYDWIREKKIAVPGTHKPKTIYEVNISI